MPTEYVLPIIGSDHRKRNPMRALTSMVLESEKLQEDKLQSMVKLGTHQWNRALWSQQKNTKNKFKFDDFVLWFPKGSKSHLGKFTRKCFEPYKIQYVLPNNMILLVTFINFEPNPMFNNINKLKPYKFIEYEMQNFEM
jgi:hypothetical protein